MSYTSFKKKWLGRRVDYDNVYGYQCVDLIKQYAKDEYKLKAGAWGNAVDYWYSPNKELLTKFTRVSTSKPRLGDIVIFKGVNGNPYGHIGICDQTVKSWYINCRTLEQNGATGNGSGTGGDAIRTRRIARTRLLGVLRPKTAKPSLKMPKIGSRIVLSRGQTRTTFKPKTRTVKGRIKTTGDWGYTVRGYDPVYAGRIIINSRSGGGNGVALALYYTNGKRIEGWK